MKTIATRIHRAQQAGQTVFISLEELVESDLDDHSMRDLSVSLVISEEELVIPVVDSEISVSNWDGSFAPHLLFNCPRCNRIHCTDLYDGDPNPRFACCDSCSWDSLVWLNWDQRELEKMRSEQAAAPNRSLTRVPKSEISVRGSEGQDVR